MLSEGRLLAYRQAIVDDLRDFLPDIREVTTHFGPFDLSELKNFSMAAPAIRVSILGWQPGQGASSREIDCPVHVACYIVTKSTAAVKADAAGLDIAEAVAGRYHARSLYTHAETAKDIACTNHYSGQVRELGGIALFSVDWHTNVRIGTNAAKQRYGSTEGAATVIAEISVGLNGGAPVPIGGHGE